MRLLAKKPTKKHRHDYSSTNVTTGAWVEVLSTVGKAVTAVEIFDSSGRILKLSTGAAGQEDSNEIPYYIIPGGSTILLPIELGANKRIAIRAVDANATTGSLILNFFD